MEKPAKPYMEKTSVLQIRTSNADNLGILFYISPKNTYVVTPH